jgi:type IV secretion system protein VirB10
VSGSAEEDDDAVPLWRQPAVRWIALAVVVVVSFVFWRGTPPPKEDEPAKPPQNFIGDVTPFKPALPQAAPAPPPTAAAPAAMAVQPAALPQPAPPPSVRMTAQGPATAPAKPARPLMLSYAAPLAAQAPAPGTAAAGGVGGRPAASQTNVVFKGGEIPGAKASAAIDTTYVLMPGLLPCVLDTAISSDVPSGSLMCHTPGPVYSPKGVLLMEADTQIVGRYEGLKNGGNRLQAISTYAVTPNGIFVPITDNMSDDLGRTGLDGNVDHRYIERFGAAIALELTQSVLSIIQAEASKGGNSYIQLGNGGGGGVGGLAEQILQSTINLPPIFTKPQGATIAIFLSAPVDFSASYRIRETRQ